MAFQSDEFDNHEFVAQASDPSTGLRAILALHSTALGPALGGCRMFTYASGQDAMADALRLSRGMTYKNALAGIPYGGGKSVIIAPTGPYNRKRLMHAFGQALNKLAGNYYAAEDSGTTVEDMEDIAQVSPFVTGRSHSPSASGDPSHYTALGVFLGIKECLIEKHGSAHLKGRHITISGMGNVGLRLAEFLHSEGAKLTVADINTLRVDAAAARYGATVVDVEHVHAVPADVFAPCAMGGAVNANNHHQIAASIIAGAANNQLQNPQYGEELKRRGILYAPDFAINAGGVINVSAEVDGKYDAADVTRRVERIPHTLREIFARTKAENKSTSVIAVEMARERIDEYRNRKLTA